MAEDVPPPQAQQGNSEGETAMDYVCDGPGSWTWFRLTSEAEAMTESALMGHAVEKHYRRAQEMAADSFEPSGIPFIEQGIARQVHVARAMPWFLTLRDAEGTGLVTAMLPPRGKPDADFRCVMVGRENTDPYPHYGAAIDALARHTGVALLRETCFPYRR
jgi:hypothetical protein